MRKKEPASFTDNALLSGGTQAWEQLVTTAGFQPVDPADISADTSRDFPDARFYDVGTVPYRGADRETVGCFLGDKIVFVAMGTPHAATNTTRRARMTDAIVNKLGFAPAQVQMTDDEDDQLDAADPLSWRLAKYIRGDSPQI